MRAIRFLITALITLSCAGCGTILHGTRQDILVTSDPAGAVVTDGRTSQKTPAVFRLDRGKEHVLLVRKEGCEDQNIYVSRDISGLTFINVLFWPGFIVDAVSGGMWRLSPENPFVVMKPVAE